MRSLTTRFVTLLSLVSLLPVSLSPYVGWAAQWPVRAHASHRHLLVRDNPRGSVRRHAGDRRRGTTPRPVHDTGSVSNSATLLPHKIGDMFGVGAFITQRSSAVAPLVIGRARLLGTTWVREEFTATRLHGSPTAAYDWVPYDHVIQQERRAGLQVLGLLDYSNSWGFGDHGVMLHRDIHQLCNDYAAYVYAVARHYRGTISYWQIWNEPNLTTFWHPVPNPYDYADLLKAAYRAIKSANPAAKVVLAGTSGVDIDFLRRVIAQTRSFDIISVHPYRNVPEQRLLGQIHSLQAWKKPVWFSEIGWAAGDGCGLCTGENVQAQYLVRFYALAAAAGVQRVFWYDLRDDGNSPISPEAHFGLMRKDLSAKPAFVAYHVLSSLLRDSTFIHADAVGRHAVYALRFRGSRGMLGVVWNTGARDTAVSIPWRANQAYLIALDGTVIRVLHATHRYLRYVVPATGEPQYLSEVVAGGLMSAPGPLLHLQPARSPRRIGILRPQRPRAKKVRSGAWADPSRIRRSNIRHHHAPPREHQIGSRHHRKHHHRSSPAATPSIVSSPTPIPPTPSPTATVTAVPTQVVQEHVASIPLPTTAPTGSGVIATPQP